MAIGREHEDMVVSPLEPGIAWQYWPPNVERFTRMGERLNKDR
jgi:hypothetical protein